ncbi:4-alpha-glucanotransferase [Roseitranquillus sediminis]|uniref:4-alpha-glucanotransferase n=1 Tax=Roseitranquillus sediminis TaxID=2809051 RepID=UPI001D0C47CC|nr:4-alpha-glucanotransferase [Roseitranquillus sediminis]MBM9596393.1 4-alpha-glucanotransferase [Roseitranquillus sediminis]
MTEPLEDLAREAGVAVSYVDQMGDIRTASPETLRAILAALEMPAATDGEAAETLGALRERDGARRVPEWQVVEAGRLAPAETDWAVTTEAGETVEGGAADTVDLPPGYHRLRVGSDTCLLLAVPPRAPLPQRDWGVTLPLYGLRPAEVGGIGDYADLASAVLALGRQGASFVGINPIHAGFLEDAGAVSPYSPSHRRRLNALHVAVPEGDHPGWSLIDYDEAVPAKRARLARAFERFRAGGGDAEFDAWVASEGEPLRTFAVHQALSEVHGSYWSGWPKALQDARSPEVAAFANGAGDRIVYHQFLQWRAAQQLGAVARAADQVGMSHGLYLDLAVGTHPHGAETWTDPGAFASGVSLGAPPDAFSAEGQNWGLAPLSPRALVADGFRPLIETLRMQLNYARLLRIDHILGFERAFWVPQGAPGTYVTMPKAAMLAVVRIEAHRAGAVVVGEDLGNVPEGLQDDMSDAGLLGCRVAMFERDEERFRPPPEWEPRALASFGTHDLPTFAGWRRGCDIDWRHRIGDIDGETAAEARRDRARDVEEFATLAGGEGVDEMHAHLSRTASALVALQIEDILELEEQPNLPGTVDEHPNWRRRLPLGPEALADDVRVARAAGIMSENGR